MRMKIVVVIAAVFALALGLAPDASATIGFSQQVKLRDDHGPYTYKYSAFNDGYNGCSYCTSKATINRGQVTLNLRTYRLVESNREYDYYLVDATVSTSKQHGTRGSGVLDATLRSVGKVNNATYSSGHSDTSQDCHSYTVSIAGAWGPLSVGTDVGTYSTCVSSHISRSPVSSGQSYHVTNLNGVKSVTFQRFDRVLAGQHPSFSLALGYRADRCGESYIPSTGTEIYCNKVHRTHEYKIGTTG